MNMRSQIKDYNIVELFTIFTSYVIYKIFYYMNHVD